MRHVRKDGTLRVPRMLPRERKQMLLDHAVAVAQAGTIDDVTRAAVARAAGVTHGLINRYFDGVTGLRAAVKRRLRK